MTVGIAKVDLTGKFPLKQMGGMHLMRKYRQIYLKIRIYEVDLREIMKLQIQKGYKYGSPLHIQTLLSLRF